MERIRPEESLIEHNKSIVVTFHSSYESRRFSAPRNILSRFVFFSSRKKRVNWEKTNPLKLSLNKLYDKRSSDDLSEIEIIHFQMTLPIAMKPKRGLESAL